MIRNVCVWSETSSRRTSFSWELCTCMSLLITYGWVNVRLYAEAVGLSIPVCVHRLAASSRVWQVSFPVLPVHPAWDETWGLLPGKPVLYTSPTAPSPTPACGPVSEQLQIRCLSAYWQISVPFKKGFMCSNNPPPSCSLGESVCAHGSRGILGTLSFLANTE